MNDHQKLAHAIYRRLPRGFSPQLLGDAVTQGMLSKDQLTDGGLYWGHCRNAGQARWDATRQRFVYSRTKFTSTFDEDIVHPQDDEGYDVFVPVARIDETPSTS